MNVIAMMRFSVHGFHCDLFLSPLGSFKLDKCNEARDAFCCLRQVNVNLLSQNVQNVHKNFLSGGFCSTIKIVTAQLFVTSPYFCWQLTFYRHLPTSGRQNTDKTAPQPLIVNSAFVALYVGIILPIGPIPISLFVFEL